MIYVLPTHNYEIISSVITHPDLYELSGYVGEFKLYPLSSYLAVYEDNRIVGIGEFRPFNNIIADSHIYILPQYQGSNSVLYAEQAIKFIDKYTKYTQLMTSIPLNCKHAIRFVKKLGFKESGKLINGILYKNIKQDLLLFHKEM